MARSMSCAQDSSNQDIEKRDEAIAERRREGLMERRDRNRNRGGGLYINSDNNNEFWDADTNDDGKVSREEFLDTEVCDEDEERN